MALDSDVAGDQATLRGLDVARQVMDREVVPVPTPQGLIRFEERLAADIDPPEGVELSTRLLESDPLDEAAMGEHLKWLARGGQGARARQAYREFAERLGRELGLAPGTGLKAMHDSIVAVPPAAATSAPPAPKPADDGFVGRAAELRRIATLLGQEGCRLL